MAHSCPDCGRECHCGGDIDDINFGDDLGCECDHLEDWERIDWGDEEDDRDYDADDYDGPQW